MTNTLAVRTRLRKVVDDSRLSRRAFARRLGYTSSALLDILAGRIGVISGPLLKILELEFGVNPAWLQSGKEPAYLKKETLTDEREKEIIIIFRTLPSEGKLMVVVFIKSLCRLYRRK